MDHRFSTLFIQPPRTPLSPEDATMSGALPDPSLLGKRKFTTMKQLVRKLFGIPRQKKDPLIMSAEPVPSELSQRVWSEVSSISSKASSAKKSTTSTRKMSKTNETFVILPPNSSVSTFKRRDIFHKSKPSTSSTSSSLFTTKRNSTISASTTGRDSKFSSISSLPSLASLSLLPHSHPSQSSSPGPTISLSVTELALLQSLVRKIARQLKKQEYLTNHLAGNLVFLFARKEAQIHGLKRLRIQEREMGAREVFRVKEVIGRGFLRRGVLVGRSEGALNLLRTALDTATRAPSTPPQRRRSSSTSPSLSSKTPSPSPFPTPPTFSLPLNTLNDTTSTLLSDLSLHSILNSELKTQIYTSCLKSRWNGLPGGGAAGLILGSSGSVKGNVSDRIMMQRFVSFVESRISLMEECDKRLVGLVKGVEELGKRGI